MKHYRRFIIALLVFLASCTSRVSTAIPTTVTATGEKTSTPSVVSIDTPVPTKGVTSSRRTTYTYTPTLPVTPSPTTTFAPGSVPTFDARLQATITSVPPAVCPPVNASYQPIFPDQPEDNNHILDPGDLILDALNQGAALRPLQKAVAAITKNGKLAEIPSDAVYAEDVTGDGIPEIIYATDHLMIYTCQQGKYVEAFEYLGYYTISLEKAVITDVNRDGVNEIVLQIWEVQGFVSNNWICILRWNGTEFVDLIVDQEFTIDGIIDWSVIDTDGNGIQEVVVRSRRDNSGDSKLHGPWREEIYTYAWNGDVYFLRPVQFDPPEYRFQAVQDGDRAIRLGDYAAALPFFDQAIEDPKLKGWGYSFEHNWQRMEMDTEYFNNIPTQTPLPPDPIEVPTLKAYAHFRKMAVYIKLGQHDLAQKQYQTLQETYPTEQPGSAYAELAKMYWESYEKGEESTARCRAIRDFVYLHKAEVLEPINVYAYGFQNLGYSPEDFCIK